MDATKWPPLCDSYEARLMKTLQSLNQSEGNNNSSDRSRRQLEQRQI
jgi:hypothetical protein